MADARIQFNALGRIGTGQLLAIKVSVDQSERLVLQTTGLILGSPIGLVPLVSSVYLDSRHTPPVIASVDLLT